MADDIRRIVLKMIKDEPSQKEAGKGKQLAVVQWAKGTQSISVQLVQSDYWKNENDGKTYHKAKGINLAGLLSVFSPGPGNTTSLWTREKLGDLFRNPPAVKAEEKAPEPAGGDMEEVPF